MKTSFVNVLRMSSFANTIVGVVLAIEFFINIKVSYGLVCLLPMVYMGLFIKVFRSEIENNGIENFVKKFTPEGTRVRNYGSDKSNEKKTFLNIHVDLIQPVTDSHQRIIPILTLTQV